MQQVHLSQPVQEPIPVGLACRNIYLGHFYDHADSASNLPPRALTSSFSFAIFARATAAVYSVAGRRVATLLDADLPAGWHPVTWNGRDGSGRPVAAGVYPLRLTAAGERVTRKIVRVD